MVYAVVMPFVTDNHLPLQFSLFSSLSANLRSGLNEDIFFILQLCVISIWC